MTTDQKLLAGRIDWRPVLDPKGPWSALVHAGSGPALVASRSHGLAYVTCPYQEGAQVRREWHLKSSVRLAALAAIEVARLAVSGTTAICPVAQIAEINHSRHVLGEDAPEPLDARFWLTWSRPFLIAARVLVVPDIPGWDRCPTIWRELSYALDSNMPVHIYAGRR